MVNAKETSRDSSAIARNQINIPQTWLIFFSNCENRNLYIFFEAEWELKENIGFFKFDYEVSIYISD